MPPEYRSRPNLISKDVMPVYSLSQTVQSVTKPGHSVSTVPIKTLRPVTLCMQLQNRSYNKLFAVLYQISVDVLLSTALIDEQKLEFIPEKRIVAVLRL